MVEGRRDDSLVGWWLTEVPSVHLLHMDRDDHRSLLLQIMTEYLRGMWPRGRQWDERRKQDLSQAHHVSAPLPPPGYVYADVLCIPRILELPHLPLWITECLCTSL